MLVSCPCQRIDSKICCSKNTCSYMYIHRHTETHTQTLLMSSKLAHKAVELHLCYYFK